MNLKKVDGHTFDNDILSNGTVVDLGCRGFEFSKYMLNLGCNVIAVDADPSVFENIPNGNIKIYNNAISTEIKKVIIYNALKESGYTSEIKEYHSYDGVEIDTIRINDICPQKDYEILKLDIEGSEYSILSDPNFIPYPKQITVEFHEHNLKQIHDAMFGNVITNISRWYDLVYTMDENEYKYIDCLFIRR